MADKKVKSKPTAASSNGFSHLLEVWISWGIGVSTWERGEEMRDGEPGVYIIVSLTVSSLFLLVTPRHLSR